MNARIRQSSDFRSALLSTPASAKMEDVRSKVNQKLVNYWLTVELKLFSTS